MHNAIPGARRAFALAAETTVQARPGATQAGASIGSARQIAQAAPVESCRTPTDSRLNWRPAPAPPAVTASTPADNPLRRNNAARHGPVRTRRRRPHTDAPVPSSRCPAFDTAANTNAVASATTPPHSTRTGCAPRPPGIRAAHRRTERRAPPRRSARLEDPDPLSAVVAASVFTWGFPPPRCVFRPHSAPFSRIGSTARCQKTDKCCRSATRKGPPPAENLTPRGGGHHGTVELPAQESPRSPATATRGPDGHNVDGPLAMPRHPTSHARIAPYVLRAVRPLTIEVSGQLDPPTRTDRPTHQLTT